jgi:hypothetical protein
LSTIWTQLRAMVKLAQDEHALAVAWVSGRVAEPYLFPDLMSTVVNDFAPVAHVSVCFCSVPVEVT